MIYVQQMKSFGRFGLFLLASFLIFQAGNSQGKSGGLCFRVDDNQSIEKWTQYASVFNKYNKKFCFALNLALIEDDKNYLQMIRTLQANGHELQDHTPNHATQFFTVPIKDTSKYASLSGVDHIAKNVVCLKYDSVNISTPYAGEGLVRVGDSKFISNNNGGFSQFAKDPDLFFGLYIREWKRVFICDKVSAGNPQDPDTMEVISFWREKIKIEDYFELKNQKLQMEFLTVFDIAMNHDALTLLAQRTLDICTKNGISRPVTWIQPGGKTPQLSLSEATAVLGKRLQYSNSAVYRNSTLKCFNEYNADQSKQYGMQWGDFYEDFTSFSQLKNYFAGILSKHFVLIGHSHFFDLLGGWDGYIARMDSLLQWAETLDIPIRTQSQWATLLYQTPTKPYDNIFPGIHRDINGDNVPDGYVLNPSTAIVENNNGVSLSNGYSIKGLKPGLLFSVNGMAGIEKGANTISYYARAEDVCELVVEVSFPESKSTPKILIRTKINKRNTYTFFSQVVTIPSTLNVANISFSLVSEEGNSVDISGITFRKRSESAITITSSPTTSVNYNSQYKYQITAFDNIGSEHFNYSLISSPSWLSIDTTGLISGKAPKYKGSFEITAQVRNTLGSIASQSYLCKIISPFNIDNIEPGKVGLPLSVHNHPNPFNPSTNISVSVEASARVTVDIYNILGQKISSLFSGILNEGDHIVRWNGDNDHGDLVSAGIYIYIVSAQFLREGNVIHITKKMLLLK